MQCEMTITSETTLREGSSLQSSSLSPTCSFLYTRFCFMLNIFVLFRQYSKIIFNIG